jgi:hypothetical protein
MFTYSDTAFSDRAVAKYRFSPILHTILRDGLFFYFLILCASETTFLVVSQV